MKKAFKLYLGVSIIVLLTQCREKELKQEIYNPDEKKVSIVRLIAAPDLYHKKTVQVKGFVNIDFEDCVIYLSKEDFEHGLYKNGISIDLSKDEFKKLTGFDEQYVLLEGIFDKTNNGHMDNFSGSISHVTDIALLK
ncbi:hypothetical protein [Pedobacter sp. FW305-3-2-15-E-R2A2]|jgi:hypothetical protein|uniref:hypothetical protein n=1 Tax=Pedobacter sp. FW305-3-2-15-E-R2A2 TaxID=3140251 RepID=UPI0031401204